VHILCLKTIGKRGMTALSKKALTHHSTSLDSTVSTHQEAAANTPQPKRRKKKQQDGDSAYFVIDCATNNVTAPQQTQVPHSIPQEEEPQRKPRR